MSMQSLGQDVRHALRGLAKNPGFALVAVLTLGLGMGATTTIVSVVQNILFDPFPGHTVERVVSFQIRDLAQARPGGRSAFPVAEFLDYQEQLRCFEEVIGGTTEDVLYATGEGTEQFLGGLVTVNNFSFLGMPAALGRTLGPEDARPGAPPVFVATYRTWRAHFGGDAAALGRSFILNDVPTTLVGVMPPTFGKLGADLYRPVVLDRADAALAERFFMFQGRLRPGMGLEEAEAEIAVVAARLAKVYPKLYPERFAVKVVSLLDSVIGPFRATLYTLAAAVGLLLLIACSNVANLLLARATTREREMAVRASLGASRSRLVRQMLVESFVLAAAGAVLGCVIAHFGLAAIVAALPGGLIPRQTVIRLNLPVLSVSAAVAAATALLCGLVPALRAARRDLVEPLKDSGKGTSGGRRHRFAGVLVVAEVALSLVLLAGAGLLVRSFAKLQAVDLGFDPSRLLHARVPLPRAQYADAADRHRLFREVLGRLQHVPGVVAVATGSGLPPFGAPRAEVDVPGSTHGEKWRALVELASEGYADVLGLGVRQGRFLSEADVRAARRVAVVNETFVRSYLGGHAPLGRAVVVQMPGGAPDAPGPNPSFEIVGVVGDAKNAGLQEPVAPEVYLPYTVTGAIDRHLLVRTAGPPEPMLETVKREVWAVDRGVALTFAGSLRDALRDFAFAEPRLILVILGVFAGVGLVLVALGVFSVIAYTVSGQTHEIGIRMALGAARADVLRMVLGLGLKLVGMGAALGVVASLGLTRVLSSHLYGVTPSDPGTFAVVLGVIALAGACASYLPALRATRVEPLVALRGE